MSDVLKKPVHAILYRDTGIDQIAREGRVPAVERPSLPSKEKPKTKKKFNPLAGIKSRGLQKASMNKVRLQVVHDQVPPIPEDKMPPCDTCKTAPCCKVFLVEINELEYESGMYGEHAVEIPPEAAQQLKSRGLLLSTLTDPVGGDTTQYYLEGRTGVPCPFLQDDNRCGIYDHRPITCRMYSCVGDSRITEGMREGTERLFGEADE